MVEPSCSFRRRWKSSLGEEIDDPVGKLGVAGRGIAQIVECIRKTREIVNRPIALVRDNGWGRVFPYARKPSGLRVAAALSMRGLLGIGGRPLLDLPRRRALREGQRVRHGLRLADGIGAVTDHSLRLQNERPEHRIFPAATHIPEGETIRGVRHDRPDHDRQRGQCGPAGHAPGLSRLRRR